MSVFQFKGFNVRDDNSPMKVGADSVLLGAWVGLNESGKVLDVGSGNGLLSFMMSFRKKSLKITGVEIDEGSYLDSVFNLSNYQHQNNIEFKLMDFKLLDMEACFDTIISNPPYFNISYLSPSENKNIARSQIALTIGELILKSVSLLKPGGRLVFIYPYDQSKHIMELAVNSGFSASRMLVIRHNPASSPKRAIYEFSLKTSELEIGELMICDEQGAYTQDYKELTRDFYLKF